VIFSFLDEDLFVRILSFVQKGLEWSQHDKNGDLYSDINNILSEMCERTTFLIKR